MKQKRLYPAPVFSIFFKTMIKPKAYFQTSRPYKSAKTGAGFTLIELLVVISIIGLLASVVLVSLNSARGKARNTKRLGDIRQLVTAFNLALDSNGSVPDIAGSDACIAVVCGGGPWTGIVANAAIDNFFAPYIKKPTDPQDNTRGRWGYVYGDHYSGIVPYDGYVLSNATYIEWTMEGSVQPASCSPGRVWSATANWFDCLYVLN